MSKKIIMVITVILFIGALFQSAVVVDYHVDGFNLGFFKYNEDTDSYFRSFSQNIRERFYKPFDIMVRSGEKTWVLRHADDSFASLWSDGRKVLSKVLEGGFESVETYWGDLCEQDGITYTLGNYFPLEYLTVMAGTEEMPVEFNSVDKIMVIPKVSGLDIYLKSESGILKSSYSEPTGLLKTDNFTNLVELLSKDPYYSKNSLTDISRFMDERVISGFIEADIPVNFDVTPKVIPWVKVGLPDTIRLYIDNVQKQGGPDTEGMEQSAEVIKDILLYQSVNVYETLFDSSGNLFFSNQFNMYEVDTDGTVRYRYTPGTEGDEKGSLGAAFQNAVETLDRIMDLSDSNEADIYLSSISETDDVYQFTFDYRFNSGAIVVEDGSHSINISATATRTIEAEMLPLEIEALSGEEYIESEFVTQFLLVMNSNGITELNRLEAYNMYLGYENFSGKGDKYLKPVWIIEKKDGTKRILELPVPEAGE